MKTAQVLRRFSFADWGATENLAWHAARELALLGVEGELLATAALNGGGDGEENRDGVAIRRFPYHYGFWPLSAARRLALDKREGDPDSPELEAYLRNTEFDVLHCHTLGKLAATVMRVADEHKIPYVITCRGAQFKYRDTAVATHRGRPVAPGGPMLEYMIRRNHPVLARAAAILTADSCLQRLLAARFPDKRVEYFPTGVAMDFFRKPAGVDFRAFYQIPPQRKILLSVGRIEYEKNQKALIDTLAILSGRGINCQLVIIGAVASNWYCRELIAMIRNRRLKDRVTLIPGLPPDDERLAAAHQAAALYLMCARHDATGSGVLEAWSAGVPVIAAPVGAAESLIDDGINGYLASPADLTCWMRLTEQLLNDRNYELREHMTVAAARKAEQYRWSAVGKRLKSLYSEVASGGWS